MNVGNLKGIEHTGKSFDDIFTDAADVWPAADGLGHAPEGMYLENWLLVGVFQNREKEQSGEKPIVAAESVMEVYSLAAIREIWNEFIHWRTDVMPTLPEEEQLFTTSMNHLSVCVVEDENAFSILFAEEESEYINE